MTPTAGGVVFFGDIGGNFYALDAANGQKLRGQELGGAIGGGVITYTANGAQKVAVASGFTMLAWPTKIVTAKIEVLGLNSDSPIYGGSGQGNLGGAEAAPVAWHGRCLLYTSPSPRDRTRSRMPSSA